ncbi:hypothetical protein EMIHUDRAFT_194936 [Emiliania huxleyi CCMP1516]|uniref:Uncharacterized protein n=2 Tax=Emiliania huxleyi TaxID=2903 RepID=A0A0D3L2D7_EMIH1|nr:hypothetical protein EMIHUDRAFT_194936 [Emiliania huxleyi CCMP1516]EOD42172.1 hypothetical protein EMIHUDRAFT_194936 [Emiliania huxleyi CCMP1516]|eukprot:XP_005794601.1 hypothetical protein EMIHUDRAFT_194936 [Emiliania huxleyi CCMP1516]
MPPRDSERKKHRDRRDRDRRERSRDRGRRHDEEEPRKRRSGFSSGWDLSSNQAPAWPSAAWGPLERTSGEIAGQRSAARADQTGPDVAMPLISPQLMQETRLGRRVYVGNTPASALLLFDGMDYRGRQLKALSLVHPPSPGTLLHSALNGLTRIKGVVSSDVPDGPNKVFLGNVPNHLTNVALGTSGYGSGTAAPPALTMKPPPPPGGGYGAPSPGAGGFSPTNPMARLPGFVAGGVVPATMRPH